MNVTELLEYLFKSDPKLKNVQLPADPLTVDVSRLMTLLKDPAVEAVSDLPLVCEQSEMCLSPPHSTHSEPSTLQTPIDNAVGGLGYGSVAMTPTQETPNLRMLSHSVKPTSLGQPASSTLKQPADYMLESASREISEMSTVPVINALQTRPTQLTSPGLPVSPQSQSSMAQRQKHVSAEFIKRVIPIRRTFYLSYCVFDYWTLFSGLFTSPMRIKRIVTNERPRAAVYVRLIDENSFKDTLSAIRANLNLPAAELIAIARWIEAIYKGIILAQTEYDDITKAQMIELPSFKNELLFLTVTLNELLVRLDENALMNWAKHLYSSEFCGDVPSVAIGDNAEEISTTLLINLLSRHIMFTSSSLLEQINKRFASLFQLSPSRWQKLSSEIDKLYTICKNISATTSFVTTSLNVSSMDVDTDVYIEALSGVSDMADYHAVNQDAHPVSKTKPLSKTSLPERLCLALDAIYKILHLMADLAGEKDTTLMIERLVLFPVTICHDFVEELIRLLVQNMDTQCFYEYCDAATLHTCWFTVNVLYTTYVRGILLRCKQVYGFVSSGDDYSGLVFGTLPSRDTGQGEPPGLGPGLEAGVVVLQRKRSRKDHVLATYDTYSFILTILRMCDFRLVQDQACYHAITSFLREHVQISATSDVDEVCSILEPFLSDYMGNFHSNEYGLAYTLTLMHIVFAKFYESDAFLELGITEHISKAIFSKPTSLYIYQVRLQKYLDIAISRHLNRLYSQAEAEAVEELMACKSIQQYLSESLVEDQNVIEVDLNNLEAYTFQQVTESSTRAENERKKASKQAIKESLHMNCRPNPFNIFSKLFAALVDQILVDVSIHLPIFTNACFDNSIMYLEHGSKLSQFLYNIYVSASFCSSSRFVGLPSPQTKPSAFGSPSCRQIPGLYSETHCEVISETVVLEENSGKIRVSPFSIYAGLVIKFIHDKISTALVTLTGLSATHTQRSHGQTRTNGPAKEAFEILESPEVVSQLTKIKFQEVKDMLRNIDSAMATLGTAFYKFYTEDKRYYSWMANHMRIASIEPAKASVIKRSLNFTFPPDISVILCTPLLSFYMTKEAEHISNAVQKIYAQETNLNLLPFNWIVTSKALIAAGEITETSKRCNSLHYNASSAPIDGIEPVLLFLESIFTNFHLSGASLRCLFSQILDLVRVILQPIHYNTNVLAAHKMPKLMQLFSIDNILQSKNMMKQNSVKKSSSIASDGSLISAASEQSFTSSSLSAHIINQKGYKSSLDVGFSVVPTSVHKPSSKYVFSWDIDNTGQDMAFSKNEVSIGKLTIRRRMNSITLRARAYENKLSPEESIISSILPMGSGVPSGALMFSSCNLTDAPQTFSDIIQTCRVFTYRINALEVLLARISSVYDYLSANSVSYDISDTKSLLETDAPLNLSAYWILNSKQTKTNAATTKPTGDEDSMLHSYFQNIVKEIRATITSNINILCNYLINTGLRPLLQRAYCPVVMQTQLRTAWSGLEITLKDIYRNIVPLHIKVVAENIAVAALNAHAFILLDSGPRARTIIPENAQVLSDDLTFLKEVLVGRLLCSEEYIVEYKRLYRAAHEHGIIHSRLSDLYLSVDAVGANDDEHILSPEFVAKRAIQAEDLVRLHSLRSEELITMGNIEGNYTVLDQLDTPKDLAQDVITHSEYIVRVLNFRRYSEPVTREWLHRLKKSAKK